MWDLLKTLQLPISFKRQYAQPLDYDAVFETLADMQNYLSNPVRYQGQIATCLETSKIYHLNTARDAWIDGLSALETNTHTANTDNQLTTQDKSRPVVWVDNNGTVHIDGNISQTGSNYETHAMQLFTENDVVIVRDGAIVGLGINELAGFLVKKYNGVHDLHLAVDKTGIARLGDIGDEKPLLLREENPTDTHLFYWDATTKAAKSINPLSLPINTATQTAINNLYNNLIQTLYDYTVIEWNMALGISGIVTLGGNRTLANPTNMRAGTTCTLIVMQDATGGRSITAWGSYYKFPGGITTVPFSSVANSVDLLEFFVLSSTVLMFKNLVSDVK